MWRWLDKMSNLTGFVWLVTIVSFFILVNANEESEPIALLAFFTFLCISILSEKVDKLIKEKKVKKK